MNGLVRFWPSGRSIKVKPGTTLLEAARRANVPIKTRCGGNAACFMCKVSVRPGSELLPISDNERRKLAGLEDSQMRLACQARASGVVDVDIPLDPLRAAVARQLARQAEEDGPLW
ncbi:2Fe-2S iron-sulfur cluster binding domain-containing protein [Paenibacillus sp. N4]|uniref:2Fe-2S iron-sulfur cluster-binding protein n=1 Tax=Paenibacillus vietnamensis TaxID=2590547 RepID=UPI001CD132E4|nr:2Fe-2S iron-sulfur cluster-binding protein [Paenibacillus vietnamensis]MCA0754426.1 2Fe-2S iron-sulfur cluster binding domain-containing protein [Paenibacillus vietnamensis]